MSRNLWEETRNSSQAIIRSVHQLLRQPADSLQTRTRSCQLRLDLSHSTACVQQQHGFQQLSTHLMSRTRPEAVPLAVKLASAIAAALHQGGTGSQAQLGVASLWASLNLSCRCQQRARHG